MGKLFGSVLSWGMSAFSGIYGYLIVGGVSAIAAAAVAVWLTAAVKDHELDKLKLANANANIQSMGRSMSVNKAENAVSAGIGQSVGRRVAANDFVTRNFLRNLSQHVTPEIDRKYPVPCVVVRMHDAAVAGVEPPGVPDTACGADGATAHVTASQLIAIVVSNYGEAHANEVELKGWQDWYVQAKAAWEQQIKDHPVKTP